MSTQTPNLGLFLPTEGEILDISTINQNMGILDTAVGDLQDSVAKYVNVPYSRFTWDSSNKRFYTSNYSIPSGYALDGVMVTATNGLAVMGGFVSSSSILYVSGFIPSNGSAIAGDYEFICYLVCSKSV